MARDLGQPCAICVPQYPERNATLPCELRTLNTGAECGGPEDFWYYAPWRSPGASPVIDVRRCTFTAVSNLLLAICRDP